MSLIHMSANYHLIARQIFLYKGFGNFQRLLRSNLSRLKGLNNVVILHPVSLAILSLGIQHLL